MAVECIELNWLWKHTKKVRSSQVSISINSGTELSKKQFSPGSIADTPSRHTNLKNAKGVISYEDRL